MKEKSKLTPTQIKEEKNKVTTQAYSLYKNDFKRFLKSGFSLPSIQMHEKWIRTLSDSKPTLVVAPRGVQVRSTFLLT